MYARARAEPKGASGVGDGLISTARGRRDEEGPQVRKRGVTLPGGVIASEPGEPTKASNEPGVGPGETARAGTGRGDAGMGRSSRRSSGAVKTLESGLDQFQSEEWVRPCC